MHPSILRPRWSGPRASRLALVAVAATALSLAGCGSSATPGASGSTGPGSATPGTSAPTTGTQALTVQDAWVRAVPTLTADAMTGAFGKITNTSKQPVTIVSGTQDASPKTELHETAMVDGKMAMRPVSGGFTIQPGQTMELKPGGNHIMIMGLTKPLPEGATVAFTLTLKDGGTVTFRAPAKKFSGAAEPYATTSTTTH